MIELLPHPMGCKSQSPRLGALLFGPLPPIDFKSLYAWEYMLENGRWEKFSNADTALLESRYQKYAKASFRVHHSTFCVLGQRRRACLVNMKRMTQRSLVTFRTCPLRRTPNLGNRLSEQKVLEKPCQSPFNESLVTLNGSIVESTSEPPIEYTGKTFTNVVTGYSDYVDRRTLALQTLHQRIDGMYLEELALQIRYEVFSVVIEAADDVEHGADATDTISDALAKVQSLKHIFVQSLRDRLANRDFIAVEGGLSVAEHTIVEKHYAASLAASPLLEQLDNVERVGEVKSSAKKKLSLIADELDAISCSKEANTLSAISVGETISEMEQTGWNFALSVVGVSKANPENLSLKKKALRTLLNIFDASELNQRTGFYLQNGFERCLEFVLTVMQQECNDAHFQADGCRVLGHAAAHGAHPRECIECLRNTLEKFPRESNVRANVFRALLDIASRGWPNKLLVADCCFDTVLKARAYDCDDDSSTCQDVHNLLGIIVVADVVGRTLPRWTHRPLCT